MVAKDDGSGCMNNTKSFFFPSTYFKGPHSPKSSLRSLLVTPKSKLLMKSFKLVGF